MKKILFIILLVVFSFGISNAQQVKKTQAHKPVATAVAPSANKTSSKVAKRKRSNAKTSKSHLKKDGTPDKRFKENKPGAKQAAGPVKKDGTPDMRFKANKKKN